MNPRYLFIIVGILIYCTGCIGVVTEERILQCTEYCSHHDGLESIVTVPLSLDCRCKNGIVIIPK